MGTDLDRRTVLRGAGAATLASLVPAGILADLLAACSPPGRARAGSVFTAHERDVITEATGRLIPGPEDDPGEAGHPGAREADVTTYITTLIGAFSFAPPRVFAGGPYSNRAGSKVDYMAQFVEPASYVVDNWRSRLEKLASVYRAGLAELDHLGQVLKAPDFLHLDAAGKDQVLARDPVVPGLPSGYRGFTDLLFAHAIEGMYSVPEYGGNAGRSGWQDIGFPGDVQPQGYTDQQVSVPLPDRPFLRTPAVNSLLALVTASAPPPLTAPTGLSHG
jgi:hypothetical protein